MAIESYDVFVIGSGIAGQNVAKRCVKAGLRVAIADNREYGGTCANRGCDPKKVLLRFAEILKHAESLKSKGIRKLPKCSWEDIMSFKKEFTGAIPFKTEEKLEGLGIALYHQSPKFLDDKTLTVEGKTVVADHIVIASGLTPRPLDFEGANLLLESDDFLNLETAPKDMIFIGGGYIGMEFAFMAARLGVSVTVIDSGKLPLKNFDTDMVDALMKAAEEAGVHFISDATVTSVEALRKNKRVHYEVDGKKESVKAALIFNTAGRIPSTIDMDLEKANVTQNKKGIAVTEFLQSVSNERVYACGDVTDRALPLTPFSGLQGAIVAENILNGNQKKFENQITPTVVFTLPNLAAIGYSEEEAKEQFPELIIRFNDGSSWYNAKRINEQLYASKVLINSKTDTIVGVHLIGPEAGEVINLFAMAMQSKTTVSEIKKMIFAYPTWGSDIKAMI